MRGVLYKNLQSRHVDLHASATASARGDTGNESLPTPRACGCYKKQRRPPGHAENAGERASLQWARIAHGRRNLRQHTRRQNPAEANKMARHTYTRRRATPHLTRYHTPDRLIILMLQTQRFSLAPGLPYLYHGTCDTIAQTHSPCS